ncbi:dihydroxyacetone kinase subunit L [Clostridiales bacterium F-3ap]|uniref:phosphoenolpyruvate--glycerone phosphotransferase n=1 Tax=Anaerotalea alkaliphila TaxID=2662126 RepID=A0A7X5KMZ0_9FIRM|nr:dihydroxyacetone kinase subunit L [Anaerotalea alkaliphila]
MVARMVELVLEKEAEFSALDAAVGDGDFGASLAKGFSKLREEWEELPKEDMGAFLKACGLLIGEECGGASGPLWGGAFRAAAKAAKDKEALGVEDLALLLDQAVLSIQKTGKAEAGDKTMVDALLPAVKSLVQDAQAHLPLEEALKNAAAAAMEGAEATRDMVAKRGRASYLGERTVGHPDPGAMAVGILLQGVYEHRKTAESKRFTDEL